MWNNKAGVDVWFSQGIWPSPGNAKACIVNAPDCVKAFVAAPAPPGTQGPQLGKGPRHFLVKCAKEESSVISNDENHLVLT